jgi:phospholipase D1/2
MTRSATQWLWIRIGAVLLVVALLAAAWQWTGLREWVDPDRLSATAEPYRRSWLGLPLVVGVFVLAELVMFPVLVLVFATGLAFGPWLGTIYALVGVLASAVLPFLIGRWLGRKRLERWGGTLMKKLQGALRRKGVVAVFLVRKVPAPYSAVNMACGASGIPLTDFLLGTFLGMVTGVVLITVVGAQFMELFSDPDPGTIALVLGVLTGAVLLTLLAQRMLNRRLESTS